MKPKTGQFPLWYGHSQLRVLSSATFVSLVIDFGPSPRKQQEACTLHCSTGTRNYESPLSPLLFCQSAAVRFNNRGCAERASLRYEPSRL